MLDESHAGIPDSRHQLKFEEDEPQVALDGLKGKVRMKQVRQLQPTPRIPVLASPLSLPYKYRLKRAVLSIKTAPRAFQVLPQSLPGASISPLAGPGVQFYLATLFKIVSLIQGQTVGISHGHKRSI